MEMLAAQQCSLGFTVIQTLLGGLLGGFGFIMNMLVMGLVFKFFRSRQAKDATDAAKAAVAGMLRKR